MSPQNYLLLVPLAPLVPSLTQPCLHCLASRYSGLYSVLSTALKFQCILSSVKIYIIVGCFCCCLFLYIAVTTLTPRNKDYIGTVCQWGLAGWWDHLCLACAWKRPSTRAELALEHVRSSPAPSKFCLLLIVEVMQAPS